MEAEPTADGVTTPVRSLADVHALAKRLSNWGRWGEEDEIGTLNHATPERVVNAAGLVRTGEVISLSLPFDTNGPQNGSFGRNNPMHYMMATGTDAVGGAQDHMPTTRHADDGIVMPLSCGTQWDGLSHIFYEGRMYNGRPAELVSSNGAARNGIENTRDRIVGRGVLLDIPRWKGRPWLEPGEAIYTADLDGCAQAQGVTVQEGDFVLIRTGQIAQVRDRGSWGDYAGGSAPGLSATTAEWFADNGLAGYATDTWGTEVIPNETPDVFQPLHIILLVHVGLLIGEMFDLEQLAEACAADGRYEFLLVAPTLPITGAVASPTNPLAIR
ncbi:cyclase family protein [Sphaerisporangium sp. NPDC088356]|uniref:cyclase family protein n=1 Tax=Sphaerisporangium sp. NPDC088356 TaxID=3154871 RepID=UPI003448F85E